MVRAAFKFQKGPIFLSDDEAQVDSVDTKKLSRFDVFTTFLHFLSVYISTAGIGSLIWAYVVVRGYDRPWPVFREDFEENFVTVVVLLSGSIIWSIFNMWLLRNHRRVPPHSFTLVWNISMTFCLIYFPTVCCCRIYDKWSTMACEYLPNPDKDCLPVYSTILETEVIGLACAFFVALIHLIHITARVIAFIINMKNDGKTSQLGTWLYDHGYSTTIAIYGVLGSLAMIGFFMMLWAYDFIMTFGSREYLESAIWAAHSKAGFDILTLLLLSVPVWFVANVLSMCHHRQPLPRKLAAIYDIGIATALIAVSIRCYIRLGHLEEACGGSGHCSWIWKTIKPRQLAAIVLGSFISVTHFVLCLNRLRPVLQWARDRNRINVALRALNDSHEFEGLRKLLEHCWTDEQMVSIFRIRTTGDKARQYITSIIRQIHEEGVEEFNHQPSKGRTILRNLAKALRQKLDGNALDVEHMVLLYDALYEAPENNVDDGVGKEPRELPSKHHESLG